MRILSLAAVSLLGVVATVSTSCAQSPPADLHDLPLIEVPAAPGGRTLAIFLSGDGGWFEVDKGISAELVAHGIAVVGFNSRAYLAVRRTPDDASRDIARIITHYTAAWHRDSIVIVGYSRGADIAPFIVTRLDPAIRSHISLVAMLGLAPFAGFKFHWTDLLHGVRRKGDQLTLPEIARIHGINLLCIYGVEERLSACRDASPSLMRRIAVPGNHHFGGQYAAIGGFIEDALQNPTGAARPSQKPGRTEGFLR